MPWAVMLRAFSPFEARLRHAFNLLHAGGDACAPRSGKTDLITKKPWFRWDSPNFVPVCQEGWTAIAIGIAGIWAGIIISILFSMVVGFSVALAAVVALVLIAFLACE